MGNMATIKAIDSRSVHQIQSGQVIVDLCSVVKELVENSLDAGATSLDIRFKNNGLDLIEVQDNGDGISPSDYESLALKHYTSKLSTLHDLSFLQTFGFRGEALSSLCALSNFHVVTAQADQAPKASRLDFEVSGKLKGIQVVASQKGTTASVEDLFQRLPVRRRELEKNIKREYGKVLGLLHAYACISTGVRFSVKNQMPKGKSVIVFATKSNPTTKENIANVYGAKTLLALIPLDLQLEFQPREGRRRLAGQEDVAKSKLLVRGHISKPIFGEGRHTPDRQMFFVNSRPCGLPQIAKAFNEVYKSFNVSQSPFIFADFQMDTSSYDVNVSPDKRTILLHDAGALIESLKSRLIQLFENQDQTVPQSQLSGTTQSTLKGHIDKAISSDIISDSSLASRDDLYAENNLSETKAQEGDERVLPTREQIAMINCLKATNHREDDEQPSVLPQSRQRADHALAGLLTRYPNLAGFPHNREGIASETQITGDEGQKTIDSSPPTQDSIGDNEKTEYQDFRGRMSQTGPTSCQGNVPALQMVATQRTPSLIQNAFDHMRPKRPPAEIATIKIGDKTVTSAIGRGVPGNRRGDWVEYNATASRSKRRIYIPSIEQTIGKSLKSFAAPDTQFDGQEHDGGRDEEDRESVSSGAHMEVEGQSGVHISEQEDQICVESEDADTDGFASESQESYIDDEEKKARDQARVEQLIRAAEEEAAVSCADNIQRASQMSKRSRGKDSTVDLLATIDGSLSRIKNQMQTLKENIQCFCREKSANMGAREGPSIDQDSAETGLSLSVSKDDFAEMRIIGQFNLGFILTTRSQTGNEDTDVAGNKDELFIVDQHASDEKYNFERLQSETAVQNQRLVQPKILDLTAVEEEIIIDNIPAIEKNGFAVEIDTSGDEPIGRRCKLTSLPLSKEVVFDIRDLEELIVLLSESPHTGATLPTLLSGDHVPRPSKVRKMFAMRACRSSIMVGRALTMKQMEKVVRHMGMIDKPWNCPHGRPTMRHLMSLGKWNEWDEWRRSEDEDVQVGEDMLAQDMLAQDRGELDIWQRFLRNYGDLE